MFYWCNKQGYRTVRSPVEFLETLLERAWRIFSVISHHGIQRQIRVCATYVCVWSDSVSSHSSCLACKNGVITAWWSVWVCVWVCVSVCVCKKSCCRSHTHSPLCAVGLTRLLLSIVVVFHTWIRVSLCWPQVVCVQCFLFIIIYPPQCVRGCVRVYVCVFAFHASSDLSPSC